MDAPLYVQDLINRFSENRNEYLTSNYHEAQLRKEFLDPFFESLGWDVANKQGYSEAYKEVIHEDTIKIGSATKAPDYSFRIGGMRKFFVEAKKPIINIKEDANSSFQLRRYAWSAKLSLSILTDFEEFAVYDCRQKPDKNDKASIGRIFYIQYDEYINRWNDIMGIFSKEAILKGSFDKFADSNKPKKGTAEVDSAFLSEIEKWRDILARNIALRNPFLNTKQLNFAVQKTIDRIIFLRICEDRGIEHYGIMLSLLNGSNIYKRLCHFYDLADNRYNSGLFHFKKEKGREEEPDELTLNLDIDDKSLKDIIRNLYFPDSPYEFSVLSADILGQVYEQFLGKVIRLTEGHQAKIEYKPEIKKAGGIFYTPSFIVEYIVKNTIGKLLSDKIPKQASEIKILDPACGSGSFLISAYQYLLDWHRDWYINNYSEKWVKGKSPALCLTKSGDYRLTTQERKRILLNNIYGVDIDSQAIEVTKLSLLLKVLEGENEQSIFQQFKLFHERALPDLGNNIKCGNSLISNDFYAMASLILIPDDEKFRINAFDCDKEFHSIYKNGGFDIVIGNPPYGYMISKPEQDYFSEKYKHQDYQKDLYLLFLERYSCLLKESGILGIITSNTWLQSVTYQKIRKYLTSQYCWLKILHLPEKVFKAVVDTHVLIFQRQKNYVPKNESVEIEIKQGSGIQLLHKISHKDISSTGDPINIIAPPAAQNTYRKIIAQSIQLSSICDVFNGIKPFERGKGIPPQTDKTMLEKPFVKEGSKPGKEWSPLLRGSLINRYQNLWNNDYWILYGKWLAAPRDESIFKATEKIVVRQTGDSIIAALVDGSFYERNNLHIILPKNIRYNLYYLLAIMNSSLIDFYYSILNPEKGEALAEIKKHHIEQLIIYPIDFENKESKSSHDKIAELSKQIANVFLKMKNMPFDHERKIIERQIAYLESDIDNHIFNLYSLDNDEIDIIKKHISSQREKNIMDL